MRDKESGKNHFKITFIQGKLQVFFVEDKFLNYVFTIFYINFMFLHKKFAVLYIFKLIFLNFNEFN